MKNIIATVIVAIVFMIVVGTISASAQEMIGAYASMSESSKEAKSAANFAARSEAKKTGQKIALIKIIKAEHQVVAGTNYRVCLKVRMRHNHEEDVTAVVYEDLHDRRSLSHWETGGCKDLISLKRSFRCYNG